jgi:hypothetical protein
MVPWADAVGVQTNMQAIAAMTRTRTLLRLARDLVGVRVRMG